jgi:tRNA(Arg) A34 adenosine deaminase TadA
LTRHKGIEHTAELKYNQQLHFKDIKMTALEKVLDWKVRELVAPVKKELTDLQKERHYIYSLLLLSLAAHYFCPNKPTKPEEKIERGTLGDTDPQNAILPAGHWAEKRGAFLNSNYFGHNIAAFAIDRNGYIIDFDFNHNEVFSSSIEHAEARLLNRLFKLTNIHDSWNVGDRQVETPTKRPARYSNMLEGVTVYTTLESCAQCSGIMTLGNVKEVVYLQEDPGQYKIGNIMYQLTDPFDKEKKHMAPLPTSGADFGFPYFDQLNVEFNKFTATLGSTNLTSFLCTNPVYQIFLAAEVHLSEFKISAATGTLVSDDGKLTNEGVLAECLSFYRYAVEKGLRGTPH